MGLNRFLGFWVIIVALTGCDGSNDDASPSLLYVQNGTSGTHSSSGTLSLTGAGTTLFFSDRPQRISGSTATSEFVNQWSANAFDADPPNAVLEVRDSAGTVTSAALTLQSPSYDSATATVSYQVTPLDSFPPFYDPGEAGGSGGALPATFEGAALFIDNGSSDSVNPLTLSVSDAAPGEEVVIGVSSSTDARVRFCFGDDSASSDPPGLRTSAAGPVPVTSFTLGASEISIETAYAEASTLAFEVTIFVCASPGADLFSLRSVSGPGVEVSAALSGNPPQRVSESSTEFSLER